MSKQPSETEASEIPPPVANANEVVATVRRHVALFDGYLHHRPEDVVGCLVFGLKMFRADYLPRRRTLSSIDHATALSAVFRDFCVYGRDLLVRADWWPSVWVPDPWAEAYSRFLSWVDRVLNLALESCQAPADPRLRSVFAIWWSFVVPHAKRAGRIDRGLLLSDMRSTLTEAGLRGPDGLAPVSKEDLLGEAALVQLAAEEADARLLYIDSSGRGRISHRAAARVHPNRAQRMPPTQERRAIAQLTGRSPTIGTSVDADENALDATLRAQRLRRLVRRAEAGRNRAADAGIDMRERLDRLRRSAEQRGPAAVAALAYLLPRVIGVGARLSRDAAARSVSPPVSVKALRHQEKFLRPLVDTVRLELGRPERI